MACRPSGERRKLVTSRGSEVTFSDSPPSRRSRQILLRAAAGREEVDRLPVGRPAGARLVLRAGGEAAAALAVDADEPQVGAPPVGLQVGGAEHVGDPLAVRGRARVGDALQGHQILNGEGAEGGGGGRRGERREQRRGEGEGTCGRAHGAGGNHMADRLSIASGVRYSATASPADGPPSARSTPGEQVHHVVTVGLARRLQIVGLAEDSAVVDRVTGRPSRAGRRGRPAGAPWRRRCRRRPSGHVHFPPSRFTTSRFTFGGHGGLSLRPASR